MGTWGESTFENDAALDWLAALPEGGLAMLRQTLERVAARPADAMVDVDDGSVALAAAEVVAAALSGSWERVPATAAAWLGRHADSVIDHDAGRARRAVLRVLAPGSELRSLWSSSLGSSWPANVEALLRRLGAVDDGADASVTDLGTWKRTAVARDKQALLKRIQSRQLSMSERDRARIDASQDVAEVRRWLARAAKAVSIAEIFDD